MNKLMKKSEIFVPDEDGNMIVSPEAAMTIREIHVNFKELEKQYKKMKQVILEGMEEYGIKKVDTDDVLMTYVEAGEQVKIDNDRLWKEHKDVAFECQKVVPVKSSIRITAR